MCCWFFELKARMFNRKLSQATIIYFRTARKLNNKVGIGGERKDKERMSKQKEDG